MLVASWAAVILIGKGDALILDGDQALVGYGNAVRVACQIGQNRVWPAEGGLGVDHPLLEIVSRLQTLFWTERAVSVLRLGSTAKNSPKMQPKKVQAGWWLAQF